jgi:hypothetical protein
MNPKKLVSFFRPSFWSCIRVPEKKRCSCRRLKSSKQVVNKRSVTVRIIPTSIWSDRTPTVVVICCIVSVGSDWNTTGLVSVIPYITCKNELLILNRSLLAWHLKVKALSRHSWSLFFFFFFFLYPFCPLQRWGGGGCFGLFPRLPLLHRITIYSRQVISLALGAHYLGQLDSQYLYPLGSPGGPAIPLGTGCSF